MLRELGGETHAQFYPMTPQLASSAESLCLHTQTVTQRLEDAFSASVSDEAFDRFGYYTARTVINDGEKPNIGNGQLATGYRFIRSLLGKNNPDPETEQSEAFYEHTMLVG